MKVFTDQAVRFVTQCLLYRGVMVNYFALVSNDENNVRTIFNDGLVERSFFYVLLELLHIPAASISFR